MILIVSKQTIQQAKQLDLLTYLQRFEPAELVHIAGQEYTTRTHDSLKISNGKWHWFSKGIGGSTALDYLIYVRNMPFMEAVMLLTGQRYQQLTQPKSPEPIQSKAAAPPLPPNKDGFTLPAEFENCDRVVAYLRSRGICQSVIDLCLNHYYLYEEARYHNAVFIGYDRQGTPRHAMLRGTSPGSSFRKDAPKSNKQYAFSLPARSSSDRLFVYEGAIDLLSHATIDAMQGEDWQQDHRLSLGGLTPLALEQYLKDHPEIHEVVLCLDRDEPGRMAARQFSEKLATDGYLVKDEPPPTSKDYNEYLCEYWLLKPAQARKLADSRSIPSIQTVR